MDRPSSLLYLLILVLLAISAFFSASETAVSTANKLRLKRRAEEGEAKAKAALRVSERYDKTLFSILIGNNLVNIAASAIATVLATYWFGAKGAAVSTAVMTVLVLICGEVLPKAYSSEHSERVVLMVARPLSALIRLLTPLTWLLMQLKRLVVPRRESIPSVTEEELLYMLESIEEEGVIEEQERDLVQSALEFDEIAIREIVTPRVDIVAVDVDDDLQDIRDKVLAEGYSRIPVYEGSIDNIIGILFARDFLRSIIQGEDFDLRASLGEPLFVHRSMKLSHLLASLKANKVNLAVVTDDYGGTLGIVTMEDVLEELVGEIWDEDDDVAPGPILLEDGGCEVPGSHSLRDLFEELDLEVLEPDSDDYSTVNGWAMHLFEHIPQEGESLERPPFSLTVLEMDGHRIKRLKLEIALPDQDAREEEEPGLRERLRQARQEREEGRAEDPGHPADSGAPPSE